MAEIVEQIHYDVAAIRPFDELEQTHISDILGWIDSGAPLFRVEKPDKPPKHLVAYFVLVDPERRSVLLGDHIKADLWLPSGGHVEPNEPPVETVRREAQEELHQPAVFLRGRELPFFATVNTTVGTTAGHVDVSLWYLLRGDVHDTLVFDRGEFRDMAWFTFDEILESHPAIFDRNMQRFTRKLVQYFKG